MSIEWDNIEEKPDKKIKIEGQFLLDQRAKIAELESNLHQAKIEAQNGKQKIIEANNNIKELEKAKMEANKKIDNLTPQIENLTNEKIALNENKTEIENEITKTKSLLEESVNKLTEM
ncbi:MAG: hypothetical protein ACTSWY_04940, partial [Promethearchaeota archaeon]